MPATKKYLQMVIKFGYARRPEVTISRNGRIHVENPAHVARNADTVIVMVLIHR
jgi:hypothetical protein